MPRVAGERDFADRRLTHSRLRFVFLDVVREQVPEVLTALFDVLPTYREAKAARIAAGLHEYWISDDGLRHVKEKTLPGASLAFKVPAWEALSYLRGLLVAWAAAFDLTDASGERNRWVLKTALETLSMWDRHGYFVPRLEWWHPAVTGPYPLSNAERRFAGLPLSPGARPTLQDALEVPEKERQSGAPDLLQETLAQVERRLLALGIPRAQAREEGRRQDGTLAGRGFVATETIQDREGPTLFFERLALYLCYRTQQGHSLAYADIGVRERTDSKTIGESVRKAAHLLALELPERRGKRKK